MGVMAVMHSHRDQTNPAKSNLDSREAKGIGANGGKLNGRGFMAGFKIKVHLGWVTSRFR